MISILRSLGFVFCAFFTTSCSTVDTPVSTQSDYVPKFERRASGFRPRLPLYLAEVSYLNSQYLSGSELTDIQRNFAYPLCTSIYKQHIAAITVDGSYESAQTQFSIWLFNGRRLDSGLLFFDHNGKVVPEFSRTNLGTPMLACATKLLKKAIPDSQLKSDLKELDKRP